MGSKIRGIYRRGKIFWFAHQKAGRRIFVTLETGDYVEAVRRAAEIVARPELNPTQGLKADIEVFVKYQLEHRHWTRASAESKKAVLNKFARFVDHRGIATIGQDDVQRWYGAERKVVKETTAQSYLMVLRSFFSWANGNGQSLVRSNPAVGIRVGRIIGAARRLFCDFEQRNKIISGAPTPELGFIFFCGFHAGMRKNEIIEARPDWFDIQSAVINIRKTPTFEPKDKDERTIPLTSEFKAFLATYGLKSPFMLRPDVEHGKSLYRYDFDRPYFRYLTPIGFRWVTAHVMRHTFGSLLASSGCSIYKIAVWLGDEVSTAQTHYSHLLPVDPDIDLLSGSKRSTDGVSPASNRSTQR